jgi:hypothetical protein
MRFQGEIHTFVYGMVCGVWQTFIDFQPYGLVVIFLKYQVCKKDPPLCMHLVH